MTKRIHHYILTRFCLRLWTHDKNGASIDWERWIAGRLELFEQYCLPSVMAQTCKEFRWVLLCDELTPEWVRERIREYEVRCPQIMVVYVPTAHGKHFPEVFRKEVKRLLALDGVQDGDLCLTTYLDNDDALGVEYVAEVQKRAMQLARAEAERSFSLDDVQARRPVFISYDYGVQYFPELLVATRICYPNNHFMTAVEFPVVTASVGGPTVKNVDTCYGAGSHFLMEKNHKVGMDHVIDKDRLMWVEVIHECNVDNDVKMTLDTHMLKTVDGFGCGLPLDNPRRAAYLLRCMKQMWRRGRNKLMPRRL